MPEDWLARLVRLMPPPSLVARATQEGADSLISVDGMPSDYLRLVETYGFGAIADYLIIDPPTLPPVRYLEEYESPYSAYSSSGGGIIYFGTDADADDMFYFLSTGSAGRIVIKRRHFYGTERMWKEWNCELLEFLVQTLEATLPGGNPFSGTHLWGRSCPVLYTPTML